MPTVHLGIARIIAVEGADAETFLQNIITTDLAALAKARRGLARCCRRKARSCSISWSRATGDDGFAARVPRRARRRFRAPADALQAARQGGDCQARSGVVAVSWGGDSALHKPIAARVDRPALARSAATAKVVAPLCRRCPLKTRPKPIGMRCASRIGVAESGFDYAAGDAFPHDVLLDENGGVGFRKGCYIGQEVVSRMQHRGTARRRVLIASARRALPASGTEIVAGGRAGRYARHGGRRAGLAIARIDRVKEALDAGAADHRRRRAAQRSAFRPGAKFSFPEASRRGGGLMADRPALRRAPGSACCPAAGSTCSTPRRSTSRSPTSRTGLPASPAGTARPSAITPSRSRSTRCWSKRSFARIMPRGCANAAAGRAAARRAGICHRRHDLAVQVGGRRRLQGGRGPAAAGDPSALRAAGRAAARRCATPSSGPTRSPPISRRPCSPASRPPRRRAISAARAASTRRAST